MAKILWSSYTILKMSMLIPAKSVMHKIVDANIFEKAGLNLYATIVGAKYYETQSTPIFNAK